MTLKFDKNENGEITVSVTEGTSVLEFSYIAMVKQLLNKNVPSVEFTDMILEDEKAQITTLFQKIAIIAKPEEDNSTEATEQF